MMTQLNGLSYGVTLGGILIVAFGGSPLTAILGLCGALITNSGAPWNLR